MKTIKNAIRARVNERWNEAEDQLGRLALFSGAVFVAIGLGELLYAVVHRMEAPYEPSFLPIWQMVVALALTLVLTIRLHDAGLKIATLAFAISQGLTLWRLKFGPRSTLWLIDNSWCVIMGAFFVIVGRTKTGRKAHIIALLVCVAMLVIKYFATENWVQILERHGAVL